MLEHLRLAKMSFDLWGALSPVVARPPPGQEAEPATKQDEETKETGSEQASAKRSISQAELECSLYKVGVKFYNYLFH